MKQSKPDPTTMQPDCDLLILDVADESDLGDYLIDYVSPNLPWFDENLNLKVSPLLKEKTPQKEH